MTIARFITHQTCLPILLLQLIFPSLTTSDDILQSFHGHVEAENFSYYKLKLDGVFILTLNTLKGDADLYVAGDDVSPTVDPDQHDLQSVTCGKDVIKITRELIRPVVIGVYGHPSHNASVYELQVQWDDGDNQDKFVNDYEDLAASSEHFSSKKGPDIPPIAKDDEESILWTILVGILKVLLEILAS